MVVVGFGRSIGTRDKLRVNQVADLLAVFGLIDGRRKADGVFVHFGLSHAERPFVVGHQRRSVQRTERKTVRVAVAQQRGVVGVGQLLAIDFRDDVAAL